jgi:crotonobetainyl-CoA:carnitine CoA-transferase CaiB-like acyl-CoA transferase
MHTDRETSTANPGPLSGLKILDLTLALAGPLSTQRLADMGADVIKVEEPRKGDFTRTGPMAGVVLGGETIPYLSLNRNKRSLAIDLKNARARDILLDLVRQCDVVVQNFRPGVAERLGIAYEQLTVVKPDIVYVSISGYGNKGPKVKSPGQDLLVQSFSGMVGHAGTHEGGPHPAPVYMVDVATSHLASEGILAALLQRMRTGKGCHVQVSLLGAALELQLQELTTVLTAGHRPLRGAAPYASVWMEPPYGIYEVADGHIAIAQSDLTVIADVLHSRRLASRARQRPKDEESAAMQAWRDDIYAILSEEVTQWRRDELVEALSTKGVWCGPVLDVEETIVHPQCEGMFTEIEHPRAGTVRTLAPNIHFSTAAPSPLRPAPMLGQDSVQILRDAGVAPEEIEQLKRTKVIA